MNEKLKTVIGEIINEIKETDTFGEWTKSLESEIKKIFPKSAVYVGLDSGIGKHITIFFTIGKDKSEYANKIEHNDPARHILMIHLNDDVTNDSSLPDKMALELVTGGSILVAPPKDSFLAFGRAKIGFRKKTGTPNQIFKHVINYFKKMKTVWLANKNNLGGGSDTNKILQKKY